MSNELPLQQLGKLVKNFDARRVPLSRRERERRPGDYPYYGATGVMDRVNGYLFTGLHLLVAEDGSVETKDGKPVLQLVDGQFWVSNHAHVLRAASDSDTRYLFYALSTIPIRPFVSGSVQAKLSQGNMNRISVPYPEGQAVRAGIAEVLGSLDDKIELNRGTSETLEAVAQALFQSWFVDFDPVLAKAQGREPGLPEPLARLFPSTLGESECGQVPAGWDVCGLDEIARFVNGLALQKYPAIGGRALPVIRIAQLRAGHADGADVASADLEPDYIVQDGDVLFSWSGSLMCMIWADGPGALNQHLFKVTSARYPKWLYYLAIRHHLGDFQHIAAGKATTMGHIQRHHLSDAKVAVPPAKLLAAVDWILAPLVEGVWRRHQESRALAALRDTLLPKLISGELRVPDAARIAVEAGA